VQANKRAEPLQMPAFQRFSRQAPGGRAVTLLRDRLASRAMEKFVIEGGYPLSGEVAPAGNKNAALPILAASLLTDEELVISNVPRILDVDAMLALLEDLGVNVLWRDDHQLVLRADTVRSAAVDEELGSRIRASFLLAGPLLARFGEAHMPPPGGDVIGRRRLDPHLDALKALGAHIHADRGCALWVPDGLHAAHIFMDEASVMATENALMAAALTPGKTVIANAACEPHVQDLARLLQSMGASIEGIGSNLMTVEGRERLHGATHTISPDHIEVASFMALAAVTGGHLRIKDTVPDDLRMIRAVFERLGLSSHLEGDDVVVPPEQRLQIKDDVGDAIPKIDDGPWPAFPADLTSIALAVATQAEGTVLIFEKMFENRLFFVDKLTSMGARIVLCDPHRAIVSGPSRLHGERMESPDIRAGMAMLIASLCAEGFSEIGNVGQIDRGYERIDDRLRDLGARIERVSGVRVAS
jgi:UDP-N-acetylglucosamine 1-carboxyvinyltransferase